MYSQNFEDQIIADYFDRISLLKGTVVDIGANDGKQFSNSLYFIENGWNAHLFEPSSQAFKLLSQLHDNNPNVKKYNAGISDTTCFKKLYDCGTIS